MVFLKLNRGSVEEFIDISSIDRVMNNLEGTGIHIELRNGNGTIYPLVKLGEQDYELCKAVAETISRVATIVKHKHPPEAYYPLVLRQVVHIEEVIEEAKKALEARRQRGVSDISSPPHFDHPHTHTLPTSESRSGESGPEVESSSDSTCTTELPAEQLEALEEHWAKEYGEQQVEETKETAEQEKDYDTRIVNEALNILSQENGLTPSEIQKRLLEKNILTNPYHLGRLLAKSGKAEKRGQRWYLKCESESEPEQSESEESSKAEESVEKSESKQGLQWVKDGCYEYAIDEKNDEIHIKSGTYKRILPYSKIKELYEKLPEEATIEDIISKAEDLGLSVNKLVALVLTRVFSNYKDFDAELVNLGKGRGKGLRLIKNPDFSLREEIRQKLKQERDVIGVFPGGV